MKYLLLALNFSEIDTLEGVKVKVEENYEESNFGEFPNNSDLGLKLEEWTEDNVDSKLGIISQTEENFQNFQGCVFRNFVFLWKLEKLNFMNLKIFESIEIWELSVVSNQAHKFGLMRFQGCLNLCKSGGARPKVGGNKHEI